MSKYNFENTEERELKSYFPLSESVENVRIKSIEFVDESQRAEKPYRSIDITLVDENGAELRDKIFEIKEDQIKVRPWIDGDTLDQAIEDAYNKLMTRLLHYITKYDVTKDKLITVFNDKLKNDNTFTSMAKLYKAIFEQKLDDRKLYVKTILNSSGYTSLPDYPSGFLQEMSEGPSKLKYSEREIRNNEIRKRSFPSSGEIKDETLGSLDTLEDLDGDDFLAEI